MAKKKWIKLLDSTAYGKKIGAIVVNADTDERFYILNPYGKYLKYRTELRENKIFRNDFQLKKDKAGFTQSLSKSQRIYRIGYNAAIIDQAKAYKNKKHK